MREIGQAIAIRRYTDIRCYNWQYLGEVEVTGEDEATCLGEITKFNYLGMQLNIYILWHIYECSQRNLL